MRFLSAVVLALTLCLSLTATTGLIPTDALAKEKSKREKQALPVLNRPEDVLKWINDYRHAPQPDQVPHVVQAMSRLGMFRDLEQAGVYIGFIGGVLGSNPKTAERLIARMFPLPPEDQVALIRAIAYSNHPGWKGLLQAFTERMPARQVLITKYLYGDGKTLAELPLDDGSYVIDTNWGYYFATGYAEPVQRIVSALAWTEQRESVEKLTIGAMAKWTLATNATREKDLLDILKQEMGVAPENVRKPLAEVIDAAETFETAKIRKEALASIEELKAKGPESARRFSWWGTAGQTVLALGCVAASALGQVEVGIPCVVGGALSGAALKYLTPGQ
ncbi:MAG: hypothetical protein WC807_01195 [Hyphomicrobium sp.]|jgi:hypothetical protein